MSCRVDLPFVRVNMAFSADGKIASADRTLTTFGSARDARHLYTLRSESDAILCGARTIEQSHSTLGNGGEAFTRRRLRAGRQRYPLRVVVTGSGSIDPNAELWTKDYGPILVVTTSRVSAKRLQWFKKHAAGVRVFAGTEIDWVDLLVWLRSSWGAARVLSEGGGELNDALVRAGVVRELHLTWCPLLLGGRRAPTIADGQGAESLAAARRFELAAIRRVGEERFLVYQARENGVD